MTLDAVIMLTGTLVSLVAILNVPPDWKPFIFFVLGIVVIALGIVVRRRGTEMSIATKKKVLTYTESTPKSPVNPMNHDELAK